MQGADGVGGTPAEPDSGGDATADADAGASVPDASAAPGWTTSYAAGAVDATGHLMEGTELRALVPFDGKLYAGIGYWEDTSARDPDLPGAQVLALDAPDASWQVDLEVDDRVDGGATAGERDNFAVSTLDSFTLTTDGSGAPLSPPARVLAMSSWSRTPGAHIWVRTATDPTWVATVLPGDTPAQGRSFGEHVDSVTGVDVALFGSDFGIGTGAFDSTSGTVQWSTATEPWYSNGTRNDAPPSTWRVMSFVECNGVLYATVGAALYQRQDGPAPVWKKVYSHTFPPGFPIGADGGLRGAYAIPNPHGTGQVILTTADGSVIRIDPNSDFSETVDEDVTALLSTTLGTPVGYVLLNYNHMTPAIDPGTGESVLLIGLEARPKPPVPPSVRLWNGYGAAATYLVRHANGSYDARTMEDPALAPPPPRVSIRTMAISPFQADQAQVVYAGGFDCNSFPAHNTAWALRGSLGLALGSLDGGYDAQ